MSRTRGNTRDKVDRQLLHEYLWGMRDRNDLIPISQKELAEKLGIDQSTMSIIFREMRESGRLRRIGGKYQVLDPELHRWKNTGERSLF